MVNKAIDAYKKDNLKHQIATADPHQLTLMLMQGAIDRLAYAKGAHERNDTQLRIDLVSKATSIFINLRDTLDMEVGGSFAENLFALYDYMIGQLAETTPDTFLQTVDEIFTLFLPIKNAWQDISEEDKQKAYAQQTA
ncbi:MAG: flagellar export chaperone FliS [Pseudomonadota bacterium]